MFMDYAAYQVGQWGSLPPSTKVLHGIAYVTAGRIPEFRQPGVANLFMEWSWTIYELFRKDEKYRKREGE